MIGFKLQVSCYRVLLHDQVGSPGRHQVQAIHAHAAIQMTEIIHRHCLTEHCVQINLTGKV